MVSQKAYQDREKSQMQYLSAIGLPHYKIDTPVSVTYKFRFPDKRPTDLSNKIESVNDLLVRYGYFSDDKCSVISKFTAKFCGIDKENPRVEIHIENQELHD